LNRLIAVTSAPLLLAAALAEASNPEPIPLTLNWNLSLDDHGGIARLEALPNERADKAPTIRERLEQAIRSWQFRPGAINGKPQATQTRLTVRISVTARDANTVDLHIESAHTGGGVAKTAAPKYPAAALSAHRTGMVVMHVKFDGTGTVTSAQPDPDAPKVADALVNATSAALKLWKFQPEIVGDHAVAGSEVIAMCFNLFPAGTRTGKIPDCVWTPKGQTTSLGDGEALALEPAATLVTDVAGRTL